MAGEASPASVFIRDAVECVPASAFPIQSDPVLNDPPFADASLAHRGSSRSRAAGGVPLRARRTSGFLISRSGPDPPA